MDPVQEATLYWVRWWARGWQQVHASWLPTAPVAFSAEIQAALEPSRFAWLGRQWGIAPSVPPPPRAALLRLLQIPAEHRPLVLALAATVCQSHNGALTTLLDPAAQLWCRRLGKALQPGAWLPATWCIREPHVMALGLLLPWAQEEIWARWRLSFPRELVEAVEQVQMAALPAARLDALWNAVGWQATHIIARGDRDADAV